MKFPLLITGATCMIRKGLSSTSVVVLAPVPWTSMLFGVRGIYIYYIYVHLKERQAYHWPLAHVYSYTLYHRTYLTRSYTYASERSLYVTVGEKSPMLQVQGQGGAPNLRKCKPYTSEKKRSPKRHASSQLWPLSPASYPKLQEVDTRKGPYATTPTRFSASCWRLRQSNVEVLGSLGFLNASLEECIWLGSERKSKIMRTVRILFWHFTYIFYYMILYFSSIISPIQELITVLTKSIDPPSEYQCPTLLKSCIG